MQNVSDRLQTRNRWAQATLIVVGVAIRMVAIIWLKLDANFATLFLFILGMLPYVGLASVVARVRQFWLLLGGGLVILVFDLRAVHEALFGGTSTSAIALIVEPMVAIMVVPAVLLVNYLCDRH